MAPKEYAIRAERKKKATDRMVRGAIAEKEQGFLRSRVMQGDNSQVKRSSGSGNPEASQRQRIDQARAADEPERVDNMAEERAEGDMTKLAMSMRKQSGGDMMRAKGPSTMRPVETAQQIVSRINQSRPGLGRASLQTNQTANARKGQAYASYLGQGGNMVHDYGGGRKVVVKAKPTQDRPGQPAAASGQEQPHAQLPSTTGQFLPKRKAFPQVR